MSGGASSKEKKRAGAGGSGGGGSKQSRPANIQQNSTIGTIKRLVWPGFVAITALVVGVAHMRHLATLFENDRHFSHLADFEREMTYRTEMGLYYSYYKTLIEAPSFLSGLHSITSDNVTEFGHTINTLQRFTLYPEVILGAAFRIFRSALKWTDRSWQVCWQVNRGQGLEPVQSCEGPENPHYFYINGVFAVAGTVASSVFFIGVLLSSSWWGGIAAVASFAANHGEATRVQWTPPLRESFGFPICWALLALALLAIRNRSSGHPLAFSSAALSAAFQACWQFAPFVLFTHVAALFAVHSLDALPRSTYKTLLVGQVLGLIGAMIILFGNLFLLNSLHASALFSALVLLFAAPILDRISIRPIYVTLNGVLFLAGTVGIKHLLSSTLALEDDAHIFDILASKFMDRHTFHTRLYTCSAEFDFLPFEVVTKLTATWLLPAVGISLILLLWATFSTLFKLRRQQNYEFSEALYWTFQLVAFCSMASLIMRLKLFATPALCCAAALLARKEFYSVKRSADFVRVAIVVGFLAGLSQQGLANLRQQYSIQGEYSNPDQEALFNWIHESTPADAVFAGTMPVMANVKLSTGRAIINHPHYEHVGIRERTLHVYAIFGRRPLTQVHAKLKSMGATHFVLQPMNCGSHQRPECTYRAMWDEREPERVKKGAPANCDLLLEAIGDQGNAKKLDRIRPFRIVYARAGYVVLAI